MGSFLVLEIILGCCLGLALLIWVGGAGRQEGEGLEEGAVHFTKDTTVGATLWIGVEMARGGACDGVENNKGHMMGSINSNPTNPSCPTLRSSPSSL